MKTFRFLSIALSTVALAWSCQSGPSETETAYADMTSQTDSIQMMNSNLMDSLQMVMTMREEMMAGSTDTATVDSTEMVSLAEMEIRLNERKASLEKINTMIVDFESFEAEHDKGEMTEEDVKAQVEQINQQQEEIMNEQESIRSDLSQMKDNLKQAMEQRNNNTQNAADAAQA